MKYTTEEYLEILKNQSKDAYTRQYLSNPTPTCEAEYWQRREAGFKKNRKCNNAKRPKRRK